MQVLVFSDLHFHKWPQYSVPDSEFETNRVRNIVMCLREMRDYALVNNIKTILFLGDLLHQRGIIYVAINNLLRAELKSFYKSGINLVLLAGNHCMANKSGSITYIRSLEEYAQIVEEFTIETLGGVRVAYMPFRDNKVEIIRQFRACRAENVRYVFSHIPVAGSELTEGYRSTADYEITIEEIDPESFNGVVMGHYHTSQFLTPNLFYVGNLLQESQSDAGKQKGFWEMDLVESKKDFLKSIKFIPTTYPEFKQVDINDKRSLLNFLTEYESKDFYKIKLNKKLTLPVEDTSNIIIVSKTEDKEYQPRIKELDKMRPEEVITAYVAYKGVSESVRTYGLSVLDRLKQEKDHESK